MKKIIFLLLALCTFSSCKTKSTDVVIMAADTVAYKPELKEVSLIENIKQSCAAGDFSFLKNNCKDGVDISIKIGSQVNRFDHQTAGVAMGCVTQVYNRLRVAQVNVAKKEMKMDGVTVYYLYCFDSHNDKDSVATIAFYVDASNLIDFIQIY